MSNHRLLAMKAVACAVVLSLSLSACSFVFVDGPPREHERLPVVDCTTSNVVPVLDMLFTISQLIRLGVAVDASDGAYEDHPSGLSRSSDIGLAIGFAALGAGGMVVGFGRTSRCRAAKAALLRRLADSPR